MVVSSIRERVSVGAVKRESLLLIDAKNCHFELITNITSEYHNIE